MTFALTCSLASYDVTHFECKFRSVDHDRASQSEHQNVSLCRSHVTTMMPWQYITFKKQRMNWWWHSYHVTLSPCGLAVFFFHNFVVLDLHLIQKMNSRKYVSTPLTMLFCHSGANHDRETNYRKWWKTIEESTFGLVGTGWTTWWGSSRLSCVCACLVCLFFVLPHQDAQHSDACSKAPP